ncbi:gamma-glutamyltransferase family protein [Paenibacillus senegalensis]|uniref:gamma-glutamyltransferase family protein n=1 Tax=Paenibacillus senegalensis TaxID=1465766 RepID=UPI00028821AE|nr:gamma-glutamyltransferase [Paenibacillus senegalensis]
MVKHCAYGVSAAHPLAVEAGMKILGSGGNAVDAAIAVSYMLGVAEPYASGIGGGGVMLIVPADPAAEPRICDYREIAPLSGVVSEQKVGVPGFVKGMESVHKRYGKLPMKSILEPAIEAAVDGFPAGPALHRQLNSSQHLAREQFPELYPDGEPLPEGAVLRQPQLAETMRGIAEGGAAWFYEGAPAQEISSLVEGMKPSDFRHYEVVYREPLKTRLGDYQLLTCPPPFGGVTLLQGLLASQACGLDEAEAYSAEQVHGWGELFSQCYTLRSTTMGDPAFSEPPVDWLLSAELIGQLASQAAEGPVSRPPGPGDVANTTHFCVVDAEGMIVSVTNTVGGFFTTGLTWGGCFLNNQLRNFTDEVEGSLNLPQPGKRPQSYVTPTIVSGPKRTIAIGSAGGKRIPFVLATILTAMMKRDASIEQAVAAPRFFVDERVVYTEEPLAETTKNRLEQIGYEVRYHPEVMFYGGVHGLMLSKETGELHGVADPRRGGSWSAEKLSASERA